MYPRVAGPQGAVGAAGCPVNRRFAADNWMSKYGVMLGTLCRKVGRLENGDMRRDTG